LRHFFFLLPFFFAFTIPPLRRFEKIFTLARAFLFFSKFKSGKPPRILSAETIRAKKGAGRPFAVYHCRPVL
jgi:hypothetical protein